MTRRSEQTDYLFVFFPAHGEQTQITNMTNKLPGGVASANMITGNR